MGEGYTTLHGDYRLNPTKGAGEWSLAEQKEQLKKLTS